SSPIILLMPLSKSCLTLHAKKQVPAAMSRRITAKAAGISLLMRLYFFILSTLLPQTPLHRFSEPVAETTDRLNILRADLPPQPADIHRESVVLDLLPPGVPQPLHQPLPPADPPCIPHQDDQQPVL